MATRIKSVLELAKYQPGALVYAVMFRPVGLKEIQLTESQEWMASVHPKVIYEPGGPGEEAWHFSVQLPKLHATDFNLVVMLLTSEPIVEEFRVVEVVRSNETGEFYYSNSEEEWMPETVLFTSPAAAKSEKARIKALFATWSQSFSPDEV